MKTFFGVFMLLCMVLAAWEAVMWPVEIDRAEWVSKHMILVGVLGMIGGALLGWDKLEITVRRTGGDDG